jgi:hypothetical protein
LHRTYRTYILTSLGMRPNKHKSLSFHTHLSPAHSRPSHHAHSPPKDTQDSHSAKVRTEAA